MRSPAAGIALAAAAIGTGVALLFRRSGQLGGSEGAEPRRATARERKILAAGLRRWRGPRLPGGLPARQHLRPSMFNRDQLAIGAKVEKEHTARPALALEIAMAHLAEDPAYYAKLERMEHPARFGAPWILPEPDSREQLRCYRDASREARPRTYKVKDVAVRALLDANPRLRDLVDRDCGSDCRAYVQWVNGGRRGPKPRARPGDGRFDALNERFEKRTPGRKIASWKEALAVVAPSTRHWEDFDERLPVLEEAVGFRLNMPDRAEAVKRARSYVDRCRDVRPEVPF